MGIDVVRAFVHLKRVAGAFDKLSERIDELEAKTIHLASEQSMLAWLKRKQLEEDFGTLKSLSSPADPLKRSIGFTRTDG